MILVALLVLKGVCDTAGKPSSNAALDVQSCVFSLLVPHGRREVLLWVDNLVLSLIDIKARLFHLAAELSHHASALRLVLVGLNLAFVLVWVVAGRLIGLSERVVEGHARLVVAESSEVGLGSLLLLNIDSDDFNL